MAAFFDLTSLRGKITSAYITLVISTALLGIIAVSDLLFLERQVTEGKIVSDLKDAVLEMRREEKNLFLYTDAAALLRADTHAADSLKILHEYQDTLDAVMRESNPLMMGTTLDIYRTRLAEWEVASASVQVVLQDEIRILGHQIYQTYIIHRKLSQSHN